MRPGTSTSRWAAFGWWLLSAAITAGLVYLFTWRADIAVAVGGLDGLARWLVERGRRSVAAGRSQAPGAGRRGAVVWFTGLSGSGKSTIAERLVNVLESSGMQVEYLDGDRIRQVFPTTGFSRADRDTHIRRVGHLASTLERHGVLAVASLISPYAASRDFVRRQCRTFIEVFVATPLEECERRDVKGLYGKARRGEISGFTGIDDPYEPPSHPELVIDTTHVAVPEAVERVLASLAEHGVRLPAGGLARGDCA